MILIQTKVPDIQYNWGDAEKLQDWDIKTLTDARVEKCVYWYVSGSYEGNGEALMYREGSWHYKHLGHCSCYGPFDDLDFSKPIQSLSAWLEQSTPDFRVSVQPLVEALQNEK